MISHIVGVHFRIDAYPKQEKSKIREIPRAIHDTIVKMKHSTRKDIKSSVFSREISN